MAEAQSEPFFQPPADTAAPIQLKPRQSALLAVLSGVLMALCYEPFNLNFLAWICFTPFIIAVRGRHDRGVYFLGCLFGFSFCVISYFWLRTITFPVPFLLAVAWMNHFAIWAWLTQKINFYLCFPDPTESIAGAAANKWILNWQKQLLLIASSSLIWVFTEWMRFWLFTGFPWNLLGVSQAYAKSLLPVASFTGVMGISLLIIIFNLALAKSIEAKTLGTAKFFWKLPALTAFSVTLLVILAHAGQITNKPDTFFKATLVQGYFFPDRTRRLTQEEYLDRYKTYHRLSSEQLKNQPELILWPETPLPGTFYGSELYAATVKDISRKAQAPILFGSLHREYHDDGTGDDFNTAFLVDKDGRELNRYYKIKRVPYGEYTPGRNLLPGAVWRWMDSIVNMGNLTPGENYTVMPFKDGINLGVNICYDDVFPEISQEFVRNGANLLVTLTNDSWYLQTCGGAQHTVHSLFRAVETGLPFLRCGTTCESCLILPNGEVTELITDENGNRITRGAKTIEVPVSRNFTPAFYTRNPYLFVGFVICGTAITLMILLFHFFKRKTILRRIIMGQK